VSDTGIGIAPEFHHAIFHDFAQLDSPIQKRLRGTGLGLSLSKRLAELLGGSVGLQSKLGSGSTFSVTVPLRLPGTSDTAKRDGA
ncbi:MAG: ATP-binding protein, partial [Rhodospirillaceae bacterium]